MAQGALVVERDSPPILHQWPGDRGCKRVQNSIDLVEPLKIRKDLNPLHSVQTFRMDCRLVVCCIDRRSINEPQTGVEERFS